jgi:PmbA protein
MMRRNWKRKKKQMLKNIVAVGSDAYTMGTKTIGSVLIPEMKIAGL